MKTKSIKYKLISLLCWILILQLVNVFIGYSDLGNTNKRTANYNNDIPVYKIESVVEWLTRNIPDHDIPESSERNIEQEIDSVELLFSNALVYTFDLNKPSINHQSFYKDFPSTLYYKPNAPPPKEA